MYTTQNFKTKKQLKEAVKAWAEYAANPAAWELQHVPPSSLAAVGGFVRKPRAVTYYQPGLGDTPMNGTVYLEGPHYPAPHTWYAVATVKDGVIVQVK